MLNNLRELFFNAVCLTAFILLSLLFAYKSGIIKPSDNLKLGIFAATAGIGIFLFGFDYWNVFLALVLNF